MSNLEQIRFNGQTLLDTLYPIGYQYIMYASVANDDPEVAFPISDRPETMWPGTTWTLLWANEGVFFRTEGDAGFVDVTTNRADGLQRDQMQRITGFRNNTYAATTRSEEIGAYSKSMVSGGSSMSSPSYSTTASAALDHFDSQDSPDSRASDDPAGETRPTNRLMRIYRRTA